MELASITASVTHSQTVPVSGDGVYRITRITGTISPSAE
jgi:hypothetical protein